MATYQTVKIDRLVMREDFVIAEAASEDGTRQITLTGRESMPRHTLEQVQQRREDFLSLAGKFAPVVFTEKPHFNGFYHINDISGDIEQWDTLAIFNWSATLDQIGTKSTADIESRLSGGARSNAFSSTGSRFHAPPIEHKVYSAGSTSPLKVQRSTPEGTIDVYRNLPFNVHPLWGIDPKWYHLARVRFIDSNGIERAGNTFETSAIDWELSNGLVRIVADNSSSLKISAYDNGSGWAEKGWRFIAGTAPEIDLSPFQYCTVIHNTYESVIVRLTTDLSPGRSTVDLVLKRGSRFVEVYIQHQFGATLKIVRDPIEAATAPAGEGYINATASDAEGNKYIIGSAQAFDADTANGGISKDATSTFDAFIGVAIDGDSAVVGDTFDDLYDQYIGSPSESVQGVRR